MDHYHGEVSGWFDFEDIYRQAAREAPAGAVLVEVGCWEGKSLSFLLVEMVNARKTCLVYGVDHFEGGEEKWMKEDARSRSLRDICLHNCERAGYAGFRLLSEPSVDAAKRFEDGSIWFVFIDGSHDYTSVRADLKAWTPKVAKGGWMAGHDWGCSGVTDAVTEAFGNRVVSRPPSSWEVQF